VPPVIKSMKLIVVGGTCVRYRSLGLRTHRTAAPGCGSGQYIAASTTAPAAKEMVQARCHGGGVSANPRTLIMNAESAASSIDARWSVIFAACMRSEGWVLQ
jgi:hypothetical protein